MFRQQQWKTTELNLENKKLKQNNSSALLLFYVNAPHITSCDVIRSEHVTTECLHVLLIILGNLLLLLLISCTSNTCFLVAGIGEFYSHFTTFFFTPYSESRSLGWILNRSFFNLTSFIEQSQRCDLMFLTNSNFFDILIMLTESQV